jgi:peroxiredoxin
LGISPDGAEAQKKFDKKHSLALPLLSDPEHKAAELYSGWGEKKIYGKSFVGIVRSSFLIDGARPKRLSYFLAACYHSRERNDRIAPRGLDKLPGQNNPA